MCMYVLELIFYKIFCGIHFNPKYLNQHTQCFGVCECVSFCKTFVVEFNLVPKARLAKLIGFERKNRVAPNFTDFLIKVQRENVQNFKIFGRGIKEILHIL